MLSIALRAADTVRTGNSKEWLISRLNNIFGSNIRNPQNETGNRKEIQGIRTEYGRCWRHDQVGATLTLSLSVNICQYRLSVPSVSTIRARTSSRLLLVSVSPERRCVLSDATAVSEGQRR